MLPVSRTGLARQRVVIVGGGPVGLAMAIELARHGVASVVFERHPGTTVHPKARNINTRTMEIIRAWDDRAHSEMVALNLPAAWTSQMVYTRTLAGEEYGRMPTHGFASSADAPRHSPESALLTSQDRFEPVFVSAARRSGLVDLRFEHEVLALDEQDRAVRVTVLHRATGERVEFSTPYVIAADGASSRTRQQLGIAMSGPAGVGHYVNVHFEADLRPWTAQRPAVMYWIGNSAQRGVFQPLDGKDRWLCQIAWDGTPKALERHDAAGCIGWIREAVGSDSLAVKVHGITTWTMNAMVADRFRSGRVFLVGDAAQQMPPTGGFGVNTGIQEAHNLAWKIAYVLAGKAGEPLLDTYATERWPVARYKTDRSLENARMVVDVADAGEGRHREGLAPGEAVQAARRYGNFLGMALGFYYDSTAITPDGTLPVEGADPVVDYIPCARPGHRAPHMALATHGCRGSILDLFGPRFTLVASGEADWMTAAGEGALSRGVSLRAVDLHAGKSEFEQVYGIAPEGAVLVRPDGHVAARWPARPASPVGALEDALRRALAIA